MAVSLAAWAPQIPKATPFLVIALSLVVVNYFVGVSVLRPFEQPNHHWTIDDNNNDNPLKRALQKQDGPGFSHCFFRHYPKSNSTSGLPIVGEVFAAHDQTAIVVSIESRNTCFKEYELAHDYGEKNGQKVRFRCIFESREEQEASGNRPNSSTWTLSTPIDFNAMIKRSAKVFFSYLQIECPVPEHFRATLPTGGAAFTQSYLTLEAISNLSTPNHDPYPKDEAPRLTHLPICSHAWPLDDPGQTPSSFQRRSRNPPPFQKHKVAVMTRLTTSYERVGGNDNQVLAISQHEFVLWMEYHLQIGVEHFYLYDSESNGTNSTVRRWSQPYVDRGVVTYVHYPYQDLRCDSKGNPFYCMGQFMASNSALGRYRADTEWLGHWDVDEFLVLPDNLTLPHFVDRSGTDADEIHFWFPTYGECNLSSRNSTALLEPKPQPTPSLLDMETKTCYRTSARQWFHGKSLYRTETVRAFLVHIAWKKTRNLTLVRKNTMPEDVAHLAHFRKGKAAGDSFPIPTSYFERWIDPMKKALSTYPAWQPNSGYNLSEW